MKTKIEYLQEGIINILTLACSNNGSWQILQVLKKPKECTSGVNQYATAE